MKLRLGTRGSLLALAQARDVARRLAGAGHEVEVVVIKTLGDADKARPFAQVGAPGLFVRELERALLEERVDLAVHCYKDLPSLSPEELVVSAMCERADSRDMLVVRRESVEAGEGLIPLARGARVGTASARRQALLRHLRPDLEPQLLRGNVPTRLAKLTAGDHDAIVLAAAGLERLERAATLGEIDALDTSDVQVFPLDPELFVPAPSQGALALQVRARDEATLAATRELDDPMEHRAVSAERELLRLVEAGCQVPFGAWATHASADELDLHAALDIEGELRRAVVRGRDPLQLAREAHARLLGAEDRP